MGKLTYSKAGVDLERHRRMHAIALNTIEALSRRLGVEISGLGGFAPSIRALGKKIAVHVDGVGTKTIVLRKLGAMKVAGWDCVAMNANDVACEGGRVIAIADYIAIDRADEEVFKQIMDGMAEAAGVLGAPIVSGETAILPGLLNGVDVVCFTVSISEQETSNHANLGDVVIGVESWGLHANGYSLVRKVVEERIGGYVKVVEGVDLTTELARPTAIYYSFLLKAIELGYISSATHVTGGGWSKMKRVLGNNLDAVVEAPKPSRIFEVILSYGDIDLDEAYRVFNMGVGLILTSPPDRVEQLLSLASRMGFRSWILGRITEGTGSIKIKLGWRGGESIEI
ncbi:MAG: phosphoribosylformylglycinamidine cyclo-ligase [Sulfolobales archaeon]|jgi:phosphoribosylformylglycinamidine cyclo-ligase